MGLTQDRVTIGCLITFGRINFSDNFCRIKFILISEEVLINNIHTMVEDSTKILQ